MKILFIFLFLISSSALVAQEQDINSDGNWYICELKSKNKANEKKYFGPFSSKEQTLANWIYRSLAENKKYCVALNLSYMTASPSTYFGREWNTVKGDYDFDRNFFIKKYSIITDPKIEAAYEKAQKKLADKENKAKSKESGEKKSSSNDVLQQYPDVSTNETNPDSKSNAKKDADLAKENARLTEQKSKEEAANAKENARLTSEHAKENSANANENAKLTSENVKQTKIVSVKNDKEESLKNAKEVQNSNKEVSKATSRLAKENGDSDLYTLPETLDAFYKKEQRDSLAKQILEEAENGKTAKTVEIKPEAVPEEKEAASVEGQNNIEVEEKTESETKVAALPEEYKNIEQVKPDKIVVIEERSLPARNPAAEKIEPVEPITVEQTEPSQAVKAEKTEFPQTEVKVPFTFTSTQSNVTRYKKEYLQDYMPEDNYAPQNDMTLVQNVANPDEQDSKGQTLLMKAAKSGNDWQIKTLLDSGADVNIKDNDGWTALMYACRYQESLSTLKTLIDAGAKVKEKNNYDSSALILAANYNDNPEILKYLLKYYSNSEKEILKCFILLLCSNQPSEYLQIAKVNLFMEKSIPLNTFYQGKTPLMYAAQYGNSTKTLKLLLDNDALTTIRSSEGKTAFDYASKNSSLVHDDNYWALNKK